MWTKNIEGEECTLQTLNGGGIRLTCDLLGRKDYDSEDKLAAAIKAYNLTLRKDFTNKTAYTTQRNYGGKPSTITEVEVTSVIDDKEAWIKSGGRRSKASRLSLYASRQEVRAAMDVEEECQLKTQEAWAAVKRWAPVSAS